MIVEHILDILFVKFFFFQLCQSKNIFHFSSIVAPVQQRFSSNGYPVDEIGPPASFNQLPQPEGDWAENHAAKQKKYNMILAASAAFLGGTLLFVSEKKDKQITFLFVNATELIFPLFSFCVSDFQMKQSGIIFFNACPPDTYE